MIDAPTLWTLDELAGRVDAALSVGYDGQASGRVRDVPDPRAIRYYTTLGLVDRPIARRGSTVLYGPRHLLQLVAIKKLQARGLPLARIQVELAGATDQQLQRVARLPRSRSPAAAVPAPEAAVAPSRAGAFWKRAASADMPLPALGAGLAGEEPAPAGELPTERPAEHSDVATLQGVRLADGVTLLLDQARPLREGEVRAIQAAAEHLLQALRARGLGGPSGRESP